MFLKSLLWSIGLGLLSIAVMTVLLFIIVVGIQLCVTV
jgi:hypothetical protein